ncbi:member of major facilitator superfamily multidrug-resistance, DHA1 sub-family [Paxillus ammoniavirescens]|nr:member of major facilitator superfamily multidrug-resistance, DHA1 sub-family [Paxillus ammoniavirescens]
MPREVDEQTPLLRSSDSETHEQEPEDLKQRTPLPWPQLAILLVIQISEPLTSQVISPFAPQLIRDVGITNGDEAQVGFYVGLLHSLFFATEALTIFHWSRISDRVGRKPVLLTGLFGLSISMYCFGLTKTFWGLILSRCLNGALNGNIGVMRSMIAEITDSTNVAEAFAYLPFSWSAGTTLGPMIGGSLSHPAERFPNVFGNSSFFKEYPYFLPCAVPATVSVLCWAVTFIYLKETVKTSHPVTRLFRSRKKESDIPSSPVPSSPASTTTDISSSDDAGQLPLKDLLTPRVILAASSYAAVALVDIAFRTVQPVYYGTPVSMGGLGLNTPTIGTILAVLGMGIGVSQVIFFPRLFHLMGPRNLYMLSTFTCLPMIALFPILNSMAREQGLTGSVWFFIALQVACAILANFAYGVTPMYINASAPNKASVGATNGFAQTFVSVMRAVGPAAATSAYSFSIENNYLGGHLVYYLMAAMVSASVIVGVLLPRQVWRD